MAKMLKSEGRFLILFFGDADINLTPLGYYVLNTFLFAPLV